ncbi:MAG: KTSC domain-containing protein [Methanosphaera sp.]|nr:KTSC domain-containing protein [Methanosphaera sp.]
MKKIYVDSSHIKYIGYHKNESILEIGYLDNSIYHYFKIPNEVYLDLIESDDIEKARREILIIPDTYEYEKIW